MTETETGDELTNRRRKVPIRTKLLFASGTLQEATVTAGGITTMLFYNQVILFQQMGIYSQGSSK